eukprot:TRINITY_DN19221_c1_g1_i2.p1 TRINITY_DN19221_c1_g1~~TRINITY_DN19221_c1_g1_i2.p1  ORF type:complete len:1317 (-),score=150.31 TRINITY_DN19221_c1_g1_i2:107-3715(-)
MDELVVENKSRNQVWEKVTCAHLRKHVADIVKQKNDLTRLTVVVDWMFRKGKRNTYERTQTESQPQRHQRLSEFWTIFHERTWNPQELGFSDKQMSKKGLSLTKSVHGSLSQAGLIKPNNNQFGSCNRPNSRNRPLSAKTQLWAFEAPPLSSLVQCLQKPDARRMGNRPRKNSSMPSLRTTSDMSASTTASSIRSVDVNSMQRQYAFACSSAGVVPALMQFATGHSKSLVGSRGDLSDHELLALVAAVKEADAIDAVDLSHNGLLTDVALVPLLRAVHAGSSMRTLHTLKLSSCLRLGVMSMEVVLDIVKEARGLTALALDHVPMNAKARHKLCALIGGHGRLENVKLAAVGLGSDCLAKQCLETLFGSVTLKSLDIGWNTFSPEVFNCIGECLSMNRVLNDLCIANCSTATREGEISITYLFEHLAFNTSLRSLDITMNRIDSKAALMLEDSLELNKHIEYLDLSDNPLGTIGMRSILRLLALDSSAFEYFQSDNCAGYGGGAEAGESAERHLFNITDPGRRYVLDLSLPANRAVLRMLYKAAKRCNLSGEEALQDISYAPAADGPKAYVHASVSGGIWQVLTCGIVSLTFSVERAMEKFDGIADDDFATFLQRHLQLMRRRPGQRKILALLARWRQMDGQARQQEIYLKALAKDFELSVAHLAYFCSTSKGQQSDLVQTLLPCVAESKADIFRCQLLLPRLPTLLRTQNHIAKFLAFNPNNPTGHYRLDLASCTEHAVAERLLMLDRWESVLDRRMKLIDTSPLANGAHTRNELYQSRLVLATYATLAEWRLPEFAVFEVDYISGRRPAQGTSALSSSAFQNIVRMMYNSRCRYEEKFEVLRMISHHVHLSCVQLRQLLGLFKENEHRINTYLSFLMRLVDHQNEKVVRVCFDDTCPAILTSRVGFCTFMPFLQPENVKFTLDLAYNDQRLYASYLVQLANREKPSNIQSPSYIREDGKIDPLNLGVPRSWEMPDKIPKGGIFRGTYNCAPEDRQYSFRLKAAEIYNRFYVKAEESDVLWWTGLSETPGDVVKLLEFLVSIFPEADKAFELIDGPDGNGKITLRKFIEALKGLECTKFRGSNEDQRIEHIFRYMDASNNGTISAEEWRILSQLWAEFNLCMSEFIQFLSCTFSGNMKEAWRELDIDGTDCLDLAEWSFAVREVGYFGPANLIFALMDTSGNGTISFQEFFRLADRLQNVP